MVKAQNLPGGPVRIIVGFPPGGGTDALARVVVALPAHARPVRLRRVASIPETDGFRPLKQPIRELGFADGPDVYAWDPTTNRYRPTA